MAIVRRDTGRSSPADRSGRLPHLVWDWNGTLFDDVAVVVAATSESFQSAGLPPVTLADYHLHYTRPIPDFYQRVLGRPMSEAEWRALDDGFHRAYRRLLETGEIDLVPGSRALLEQWVAAGGTQSLLSMWHHDELVARVDRLGIQRLFTRIDGLRGPSGGRKAAHLRAHLAAAGVASGEAVVIGDSLDDAHAATVVGARAVLYAGGFHGPRSLAGAGVPVLTRRGGGSGAGLAPVSRCRHSQSPPRSRSLITMDAVSAVPTPVNEPVKSYAPGALERVALEDRIKELAREPIDLTMTIGGETRLGGGARIDVVQPHNHAQVLGTLGDASAPDVLAAIDAARRAAPGWRALSFDDRAAIFLKAADLLAGPYRAIVNGATMLGQSKSPFQAEIDSACELIDFWRFNVHFARQILADQPISAPGIWNRLDYRPLEGFVVAITPFNFTSIAGNLPTAPALMGNVVIWKPSPTQQFSAHFLMRLLEEAGLPPGVINMVTGTGQAVSEAALTHAELAGIHFTGSTGTFQHLWRTVGQHIDSYRSYPRLVGETGGKDFVMAHPSADPDVLRIALIRGAFEYQGQKCSAASRAYVPRSIWSRLKDDLVADAEALTMGDVSSDLSLFMGAVIDGRAFGKHKAAIDRAGGSDSVSVVTGGSYDDSTGWFVRPTVLTSTDPTDEIFTTEYFGPILGVYVYEDGDYDRVLTQMESAAPYGLTGSIIAQDRAAIADASNALRFAAGNFYINDKPTGAVVGQQPFGGSRASGTNDKAGSPLNLLRWVGARSIKETFVPPTDYRYPHMG